MWNWEEMHSSTPYVEFLPHTIDINDLKDIYIIVQLGLKSFEYLLPLFLI